MGSSLPRDLTRVSWFAGRSFTIWATREAPSLFLPLLIFFANSRISYKWTHTWDTLPLFFGMASLTQHNCFLFLLLNGIPLYGWTTTCLSSLLRVDIWFVFTFCLSWINPFMNVLVQMFFGYMFLFLLDKFLGVEWLHHIIGICLTF